MVVIFTKFSGLDCTKMRKCKVKIICWEYNKATHVTSPKDVQKFCFATPPRTFSERNPGNSNLSSRTNSSKNK